MIRSISVAATCLALIASANAQYTNIQIHTNGWVNEPSIYINPKDTSELVAGSNNDWVYYSKNGGRTWTTKVLYSTHGVWGDPCIIADTNGHFLYLHLSNPSGWGWGSPNFLDQIVAQRSVDGGVNWSAGVGIGRDTTRVQDKEWAVVDPKTNAIYVTWTQFDEYGTFDPADSSHIMFSKSLNGGVSWTPAVRISTKPGNCRDSDETVEGAMPAAGPNGEVYVSWAGRDGIVFKKSSDGGDTWPVAETPVAPMHAGWDFRVPGLYRSNGLPVTVCDLSPGPYRGTIYVNWCDQKNDTNDTDVWLSKSVNGGTSWSAPVRVNTDGPGRHNFLTWMAVDQTTGYLYFVFYDRRNYPDTSLQTDVYMAISKDGGNSFTNHKVSATPFVPSLSRFVGDYTNIAAYNGMVRPIWTRINGSSATIMTAIPELNAVIGETEATARFSEIFPNPAKDHASIDVSIATASKFSLFVTDVNGKKVCDLVNDQALSTGLHSFDLDIQANHLMPGVYFVHLNTGETQNVRKLMVR